MAHDRRDAARATRVPTAGLTVRRVPLDALHLDPANAREHGPENMEAIIGSLKRFGQAEPLVVQKSSGRVIGGNGRLQAMRKLGWQECDIVEAEVDDLTAMALGIALNRTSELAAWDEPALARILQELKAGDALDGVGYSPEDLDKLLAEIGDSAGPAEVDDPGPEAPPADPATRPGDLWLLGEHRLLCGDSTKQEDVARVMDGEKAVLMATDPPYCVDYTGMDRPVHNGRPSGKDWTHVYREVDIKDLGEFLDKVFTAVLPYLENEAALYVWHAHLQQPVIAETFGRHGLLLHQVLVWVKPVGTFGHSYYRWRHEPCAFGWRRGHKPKHGYGTMDTVWEVDWDGKARITTFHPTSKPPRLFEIPMESHTRPGAVVLEPFAGSGSQVIAREAPPPSEGDRDLARLRRRDDPALGEGDGERGGPRGHGENLRQGRLRAGRHFRGGVMMDTVYWLTSMASLAAVWLNIRGRVACFYIWAVTNAVWATADWTHGLHAQAALQAVYLALSFWGIWSWSRGKGGSRE